MDLLNDAGAIVTLLLGVMGIAAPHRARGFTQLEGPTPSAFGEFRATFGGLFVGLGGVALVLQEEAVFFAVGVGWAATAVGRLLSILLDPGGRDRRNVVAFGFESVIAALLLA